MRVDREITCHYEKAGELASAEVERRARAILRQHPNLDEFTMGMGLWHFTLKRQYEDAAGGGIIIGFDEMPRYMYGLRDFIGKWDEYLKITGEPMRFTANSPPIVRAVEP